MPAGGGATGATGTVREYVWLYEAEIAPTSGSRTTVDRPLAVVNAVNTASPATWWVSVDHLNRPVKMTNSSKAAVWTAVWQPWGAAQSITGSAILNARFPGQWFQVEAGLHYNWHRHYDPTLGRYTQPDPLGFVDGPSVYGYVGGDPLAGLDFEGLSRARPPGGPRRVTGGIQYNPNALDYTPRPPRGGSNPGRLGRDGERMVREQCDIGNPWGFTINGRDRRIDGRTLNTLSEVKNCKGVCLTRQLRDYVDYARQQEIKLDLFTTRSNTRISKPLQRLIDAGTIRHNPGFKPK